MAHYFFDLHDGAESLPDELGLTLPNLAAAQAQALRTARALISEDALTGALGLQKWIEVKTDADGMVHRLDFGDAVAVLAPRPVDSRYYFDILGTSSILDENGETLVDDAVARETAVKILSEIIPSRASDLQGSGAVRIVVRRGDQVVHEIEARAILKI